MIGKSKKGSPMSSFRPNILIVDDEEGIRAWLNSLLTSSFGKNGVSVFRADSISNTIKILGEHQIHVLLLDHNLKPSPGSSDLSGIESIPEILTIQPHLQPIMVTGDDNIENIAKAFKLGASDYFVKGQPDDLLIAKIKKAVEFSELKALRSFVGEDKPGSKPIWPMGASVAWKRTVLQAQNFSKTRFPICLLGKSGTGKTTLANAIHKARGKQWFIDLNVSAIPRELIERELFGHEKGSFTDATEQSLGFFEKAHEGTLFLDEIGDLSLDLQSKLLKVIETKSFYRLGGTKPIHSDFDLICATHRNLEQMVEKETFREDLYFRITTLKLEVPSLKARRADIPSIVQGLLVSVSEAVRYKVTLDDFPPDFIQYLMNTPMPGEIRGLYHLLAHVCTNIQPDRQGKRDFKTWRRFVDRSEGADHDSKASPGRRSAIEFDLSSPKFPGVKSWLDDAKNMIYSNAREIFENDIGKIAKALKVPKPTAYEALRHLKKKKHRY